MSNSNLHCLKVQGPRAFKHLPLIFASILSFLFESYLERAFKRLLNFENWQLISIFFIFLGPMGPKWAQNKMAPRWALGGSWGLLGGKMAPRWSQEDFKVEKVNSFPPCWGPSWDPIFHMFITRVVHKRLGDPVGLHVVSKHQFLGERGSPETWKNKQNHCTVVFRFST